MGYSYMFTHRPFIMPSEIDAIEGSEIMDLLDIPYYDLEDSKKLYRIKEVVEFFQGNDQKRWQILKLTDGFAGDKLAKVWTWVQLQKEYTSMIRGLNPEVFTEDIQEELKAEFLTRENIKMLKEQAMKREV